MEWFKNRRTATKLMLSFGLLALLMGTLGLLGLRGMSAIEGALADLHQNHALGVMHLERANTHLTATGRAIRRLQTAENADQLEQSRQDLLTHRQKFEEDFD